MRQAQFLGDEADALPQDGDSEPLHQGDQGVEVEEIAGQRPGAQHILEAAAALGIEQAVEERALHRRGPDRVAVRPIDVSAEVARSLGAEPVDRPPQDRRRDPRWGERQAFPVRCVSIQRQ